MKRRTFLKTGTAGAVALIFHGPRSVLEAAQEPAENLADAFANPPRTARAHTWWHWMNGNVTADGITRDLEAMARVGVGGVQMFDVGSGIPKGPVETLSPEWIRLVRHAAAEANRLDLSFTMHNCPGWSSMMRRTCASAATSAASTPGVIWPDCAGSLSSAAGAAPMSGALCRGTRRVPGTS